MNPKLKITRICIAWSLLAVMMLFLPAAADAGHYPWMDKAREENLKLAADYRHAGYNDWAEYFETVAKQYEGDSDDIGMATNMPNGPRPDLSQRKTGVSGGSNKGGADMAEKLRQQQAEYARKNAELRQQQQQRQQEYDEKQRDIAERKEQMRRDNIIDNMNRKNQQTQDAAQFYSNVIGVVGGIIQQKMEESDEADRQQELQERMQKEEKERQEEEQALKDEEEALKRQQDEDARDLERMREAIKPAQPIFDIAALTSMVDNPPPPPEVHPEGGSNYDESKKGIFDYTEDLFAPVKDKAADVRHSIVESRKAFTDKLFGESQQTDPDVEAGSDEGARTSLKSRITEKVKSGKNKVTEKISKVKKSVYDDKDNKKPEQKNGQPKDDNLDDREIIYNTFVNPETNMITRPVADVHNDAYFDEMAGKRLDEFLDTEDTKTDDKK